jgi:hypothetical protein
MIDTDSDNDYTFTDEDYEQSWISGSAELERIYKTWIQFMRDGESNDKLDEIEFQCGIGLLHLSEKIGIGRSVFELALSEERLARWTEYYDQWDSYAQHPYPPQMYVAWVEWASTGTPWMTEWDAYL